MHAVIVLLGPILWCLGMGRISRPYSFLLHCNVFILPQIQYVRPLRVLISAQGAKAAAGLWTRSIAQLHAEEAQREYSIECCYVSGSHLSWCTSWAVLLMRPGTATAKTCLIRFALTEFYRKFSAYLMTWTTSSTTCQLSVSHISRTSFSNSRKLWFGPDSWKIKYVDVLDLFRFF